MTDLDELVAAKYLSLTTFRSDGSPVATPVWLVGDGDRVRVITRSDSGKAKRLRRNGSVLVAPCDARGRLRGEQVPATAVLQAPEETAETERMVAARYGLLGRFLMRRNRRRAERDGVPSAGITIALTPSTASPESAS